MEQPIEMLSYRGKLLAIIVRAENRPRQTYFFSPAEAPIQAGTVVKKKGEVIAAHSHTNKIKNINQVQEALLVERGRANLSLFTPKGKLLFTRIIKTGDKVLLASGAHGFEILEDTVLFDVKQGPYPGPDKAKEFLAKK